MSNPRSNDIDRLHHRRSPRTDAEGRLALRALIPGAVYPIADRSNQIAGDQVRKDFTARPGETLDLGEILIANLEV